MSDNGKERVREINNVRERERENGGSEECEKRFDLCSQ